VAFAGDETPGALTDRVGDVPPVSSTWVPSCQIYAIESNAIARNISQVHEQIPGAYKDFDKVMFSQADFVRIVERRTPLAACKGSDFGRHPKKGATVPGADAPEL
jgi:hypothetical protein